MIPVQEPPSGLLVSVDGPGGVGKSTVVSLVAARLIGAGIPVSDTTEPSRSTLGNLARYGTDQYRGAVLALMIAADRMDHQEREIRPARRAGHVVLSDRYVAASYVLQQLDGVPLEFIQAINAYADRPDLAVILTADPQTLHERISVRGAHSRWEREPGARISEVRLYEQAAAVLAESGVPVLTLDCTTTPPDDIAAAVAGSVAKLHAKKRETAP